MIEVFKIIKGIYDLTCMPHLDLLKLTDDVISRVYNRMPVFSRGCLLPRISNYQRHNITRIVNTSVFIHKQTESKNAATSNASIVSNTDVADAIVCLSSHFASTPRAVSETSQLSNIGDAVT